VERINRHRVEIGAPALVWDERLAEVARRHSEDMARRHFFAHTNPDGKDPFDRLRAAGVHYRAAAENIAEGYSSGRSVFDGWMKSQGHRKNLENPVYRLHGVGRYGKYWTHVFVTESEPASQNR
jgi:uncharacterized protein YkwD